MRRWLAAISTEPLKGMGIRAVLAQVVEGDSQNDALALFARYLKGMVVIDEKNSCDFQYHINFPCESSSLEPARSQLNRLSLWRIGIVSPRAALLAAGLVPDEETPDRLFAATAEIHVGTQPSWSGTIKDTVALLDEMLAHVRAIAEHGPKGTKS
ncbi:MAG: hypothetical protein HY719_16800 [Planctomycetes bacterium]|nr:hypothetical protein [Planctomycetota bacterium]